MYWVYNNSGGIQIKQPLRVLILPACLLLTSVFCYGQNVSSPYSVLGIGDVDTKDFGRYFAGGNASLARRDAGSYNFSNPASLTALPFKTMNFDIATRGRVSRFRVPQTDTFTFPSNDFIVKRITAAFKVTEKSAIAFGFRPYSSVNYLYFSNRTILDGNTSYTRLTDGNGGINQLYFSYAKTIHKNFSAGITTSWLFGSLNRETQYISGNINLATLRKEIDFYSGGSFQGGLQYYSKEGKKWQHLAGLSVTGGTTLKGERTTEYFEGGVSVKNDIRRDLRFNMPVSFAAGYTAVYRNKLSFSADANYYAWPYQEVNYSRSYTNPSARYSIGAEYAKRLKWQNGTIEKYYIATGATFQNSYIRIRDNYLWDYSFSFGGGAHISRGLSVYTGLELGSRGNLAADQIKERYTQFVVGLTLKDIWVGPKYSRRYD